MSKIKQNLVVFTESAQDVNDVPSKAGKMIFNRFCIDEDAAFELSGVYFLKHVSHIELGHTATKEEKINSKVQTVIKGGGKS